VLRRLRNSPNLVSPLWLKMTNSMLDPITGGFIPPSPALKQTTGNLLAQLAGLHETAIACQATSSMLIFHLARKGLRACLLPATMMQQQPNSVKSALNNLPRQVVQQMVQLQHKTLVTAFLAFVCLGCATWGVRSRRRTRKMKPFWEDEFLHLKYMEQDEADAEPRGRNWWMSIPGNAVRRITNDPSGISPTASVRTWRSCPVVHAKPVSLARPVMRRNSCPVAGTDAEHEDGDTAEDLPAFQIFRMSTERQDQGSHESQVVPDGRERSCTWELEHNIHQNPVMPRRVSFACR